MGYATGLLEFSDDPLSDATPTYVDVTAYMRMTNGAAWGDGKSRDLDEPQAGIFTFELKSPNGEWVPNSATSLFPNSPFILRRFRWSVNGTAEGIWCPVSWQTTYPADTSYSVIEVTCVDQGFAVLSLDALGLLDPPAASSYEEVVMHDAPFAYWRLGDLPTAARATAVTGPEGTYKARTLLRIGEEGALLGDTDTSVHFSESGATEGHVEVPLTSQEWLADGDAVTVEFWANPDVSTLTAPLTGPTNNSFVLRIFEVFFTSGVVAFVVTTQSGGTGDAETGVGLVPNGSWSHVVCTAAAGQLAVYINGELEATGTYTGALALPTSGNPMYIGANPPSNDGYTGYLDEVAVYESALPAHRVMAHYQAGAERGFGEQTAGERIAAVADSPLWAETEIQTGEIMVHPVMQHGQSKLDEIRAAVRAEMPDSQFFFNGDGDPTYLGWNYKDGLGSLATFGPGGIGYQAIEPVYDDEMFNEVTVGHESGPGEETQHTVTDTDSEDDFYRRAHAETGLILSEHHDAIAVATAILGKFNRPEQRYASLTINGGQTAARTQILARQIGDMIRVKGVGVNDSDIVTTILGRTKTLTAAGHLTCTWSLARGFDAAAGLWQLGIDGFTELNQTTVLA
jgi:concanavalin A-like lectin/glucanase superfamily protein